LTDLMWVVMSKPFVKQSHWNICKFLGWTLCLVKFDFKTI